VPSRSRFGTFTPLYRIGPEWVARTQRDDFTMPHGERNAQERANGMIVRRR
jgi:hypothetical protein